MVFLQEYTMLDELGRGGFATVYKVRHNELGYIRAVRVLNETIVDADSTTYQKFLRECKLLLRLGNGNHPNIVHIYQPRLLDNKALVEMDYVDGQDILHYLNQNQNLVPVTEVVRMALQMSSALAYCHEDIYRFCMDRETDQLKDDPKNGSKVLVDDQTRKRLIEKYKVIHNDIHSGNIMRREDGNFVLLDFGLAINGDEVVRSSRRKNGAPEFKAPEKWEDDSVLTEQTDIYSFGVVLYQYLAGRVPFPYNCNISAHRAEYELGEAHQKTPPPSIEGLRKEFFERKFKGKEYEKDYPQWLEDVILKCLSKDPKDRFKNGRELYDCVKKHNQEDAISLIELEKKLVEQTAQNKTLETDLGNMRDINASLNTVLNEKLNALSQTEQLLKETSGQMDTLKKENQSQQEEIKLLIQGGNRRPGIWKACTFALLFALLVCGGFLFYSIYIQKSLRERQKDFDFEREYLEEEVFQLENDTTELRKQLRQSNMGEQVVDLNQQINELQNENQTLRTNSEYNGHNAQYWYDQYQSKPQSGSSYMGHNAQYWYNQYQSKLQSGSSYKGHDARYWYNENEKTKGQRDQYKRQLNENL